MTDLNRVRALWMLTAADPEAQTGFIIQDALGIARVDREKVSETRARVAQLVPMKTYDVRITIDLPEYPEAFVAMTEDALSDAMRRAFPNCPEDAIKVELLDSDAERVACVVADEWAALKKLSDGYGLGDQPIWRILDRTVPLLLVDTLNRLEIGTRENPLRKVRR